MMGIEMKETVDVDNVIDKLAEIESTAVRIKDDLEKKKIELSKEMKERTKDFDASLEEMTKKELVLRREEMELRKQRELAAMKAEGENMLRRMQEKFEKEHEVWADQMLETIIRM